MKIGYDGYYRIAWVVSKIRPTELTATFVVKAAYRLIPGAAAIALPDGERPTGDLPVEGGPEGGLYYETDMVPLKPKSDLLLVGSCHAPGGRPAISCPVEFQVGQFRKRLVVVGNRRWGSTRSLRAASDPEPFVKMGLGYENAFGGPTFPKNPLGKGFGSGGSSAWLPNIQDPNRPILDDNPAQDPSGFGPIPRTWPQRCKNLGTFSPTYLKTRWPWFPADFDFDHFNAAPIDQRLDHALRGDETLRFINMHPEYSTYASQLPGDRPQVFLRDQDVSDQGGVSAVLRKVSLVLDSLWVDMDQEKLTLVWRGLAPVSDLKLRDVAEIHVVSGTLGRSPVSAAEYAIQLESAAVLVRQGEEEEARAEEAERQASAEESAALTRELEGLQAEYDRQVQEQIQEAKGMLQQHGLDPAQLDRPLPMLLQESDFAQTLDHVKQYSPEHFGALAALVSEAVAMQAPFVPPDETDAAWTRERVESHLESGRDFSEQVLDDLDLVGLDFSGVRLSNASLARARLSGCVLSQADLSGASLAEADLTGAVIIGADCTDGDFTNALMDDADLSRSHLAAAVFSGASLKKARLDGVAGEGADFSNADLTDATLRDNRLVQPDFRGSTLVQADFTGAVMPDATLEESNAQGIIMTGAEISGLRASGGSDLTRGDFRNVVAERSQWESAILNDAQFQGALLRAANFSSARLHGVRFDWADMPRAIFEEAVIENSVLVAANLFRGSFERATVRRSDLRRANLYEVEFWDVVMEDVLLDGANLKMTKLAGS